MEQLDQDDRIVAYSTAGDTPNYGPLKEPNAGERSNTESKAKTPADLGAQVGVMRNLEFSAGGRAHRMSTGTFSPVRSAPDPRTGITVYSSVTGDGDSVVGAGEGSTPEKVEGAGRTNDATTGDTGPDRRRDKRTP